MGLHAMKYITTQAQYLKAKAKIEKLERLADPARNDNLYERLSANRKILDIMCENWPLPQKPIEPEPYVYKRNLRERIEDWWIGIGDFKYTVIGALFWVFIIFGFAVTQP